MIHFTLFTALQQSIKELEEKFMEVVRVIEVDCKGVDISDIRRYVTLIPAVMKSEHKAFLKEHHQYIARASSVSEIITLLNLYWDCFNYGLLELLVEKFGCKETKQLMSVFDKAVNRFMDNTTLADLMCLWRGRMEVPHGFIEMITYHELNSKQATLRLVIDFRTKYCQQYSLHQVVLIFRSVHSGCVEVVWLIPCHVVEHLSTEMKNPGVGYEVLTQYRVLEVLINGARLFVSTSGKDEEHEEKVRS